MKHAWALLLLGAGCSLVESETEPAPSASACALDGHGFDPATDPTDRCTRMLRTTYMFKTRPECWIDDSMKVVEGTLEYPCSGGGAAATFADLRFEGDFDGDGLTLCTATSFEGIDGCRWSSIQRIAGTISTETLHFDYHEATETGQRRRRHCEPSCTALAEIVIEAGP